MPPQEHEENMQTEALQPRSSNDLAAGYLLLMLSEEPKMREQEQTLSPGNQSPALPLAPEPHQTGPLHRPPQMVEEMYQEWIRRAMETIPLGYLPPICSPGPHEVVSTTDNSAKPFLPKWFLESATTVVIGKGHLPRKTAGNILLRRMVQDRLRSYQDANRRGRAIIVSDIYQGFTCLNPKGRSFGNFDPTGNWLEAQEHSAREKIAATFRDCLSHLYKSSTQNKVAKRRTRKAEK